VNRLFVVYGLGFVAMCLVLVLLNLHAWRRREQLELDAVERKLLRGEMGAWLIVASAGVLSVMLGLFLPPAWAGVPGWAYTLLPVAMPIYGRVSGRRALMMDPSHGAAVAPAAAAGADD
jgi:hypothetical protein